MKKEDFIIRTSETINKEREERTTLDKVCDVLESTLFKVAIGITTIILTYGWLTNWTFELAIQSAM